MVYIEFYVSHIVSDTHIYPINDVIRQLMGQHLSKEDARNRCQQCGWEISCQKERGV